MGRHLSVVLARQNSFRGIPWALTEEKLRKNIEEGPPKAAKRATLTRFLRLLCLFAAKFLF